MVYESPAVLGTRELVHFLVTGSDSDASGRHGFQEDAEVWMVKPLAWLARWCEDLPPGPRPLQIPAFTTNMLASVYLV